jgi:hypothetical protein
MRCAPVGGISTVPVPVPESSASGTEVRQIPYRILLTTQKITYRHNNVKEVELLIDD